MSKVLVIVTIGIAAFIHRSKALALEVVLGSISLIIYLCLSVGGEGCYLLSRWRIAATGSYIIIRGPAQRIISRIFWRISGL